VVTVEDARSARFERLDVREFRFGAGHVMPTHDHEQTKLVFVREGEYRGSIGGEEYAVSGGQWIVAPLGSGHGGRVGPDGATAIVVTPLGALEANFAAVSDRILLASTPRIRKLGRVLSVEMRANDAAAPLAIESAVLEVAARLTRSRSRRRRWSAPPRWLLRVRERIHEDAAGLTLHGLARDAEVSPSHLTRTFREAFGCSLGRYLRGCRLDHAARLLTETRLSLSEIALNTGFYDQSHFTNSFRARFGEPPGRYRVGHSEPAASLEIPSIERRS
jgi:AraC family transcriptional regulator